MGDILSLDSGFSCNFVIWEKKNTSINHLRKPWKSCRPKSFKRCSNTSLSLESIWPSACHTSKLSLKLLIDDDPLVVPPAGEISSASLPASPAGGCDRSGSASGETDIFASPDFCGAVASAGEAAFSFPSFKIPSNFSLSIFLPVITITTFFKWRYSSGFSKSGVRPNAPAPSATTPSVSYNNRIASRILASLVRTTSCTTWP